MDNLTVEDLTEGAKVTPITLRGKRAYVRVISYDDQMIVSDSKGNDQYLCKMMLSLCLCDKDGVKMFKDWKKGMKVLGNLEVTEIMKGIASARDLNGLGDVSRKKSKTARRKHLKSGSR